MGKKTIKGENDLKTWCENNGEWGKQIEEEWVGEDADGNPVKIDYIACKSSRKVKWKCRSCNNPWVTTIANRTDHGNDCTICRVSLAEWCDSNGEYGKQLKNEWTGKYCLSGRLFETDIKNLRHLSCTDCIWKCQHCGKEFEAKPFRRIMYKEGCPNCSAQNNVSVEQQPSNTSLIEWCGKNNMMDKLFSVWTGQNENNESISLNDIPVDSGVKLQWKCDKGHTYIDKICNVVFHDLECPKCHPLIDANICKYEDSLDKWCSDNGKNRSDIRLNWAGELEDGTKVDIRKISIHDDRPVIWKCYKCRIKWTQSVHDRITNLNSCPLCEIKEKYKIEPIEVNSF